jgi:hypothetical protein
MATGCDFLHGTSRPCHSTLPAVPGQASDLSYEALDETRSEIRILYPHTPAGSSIHKLEFKLRKVSLDDNPQYWAVSYVWGDTGDRVPICVEGSVFLVTRNLAEALKRVRNLRTIKTMDAGLWVDAVCINQADVAEKSWQVGMMARIYTQAYATHIWLGMGNHNMAVAMELIATIGSAKPDSPHLPSDEECVAACASAIDRCHKKIAVLPEQNLVVALEDVLHHAQYWKRAWTYQEFCMPGKHVGPLWCGNSWLNSSRLLSFSVRSVALGEKAISAGPGFCNASPTVRRFLAFLSDKSLVPTNLFKDIGLRGGHGMFKDFSEPEKLAWTLMHTIQRRATDPRDKVFSLLGMCRVGISPDYSLPVEQVFRSTSELLLRELRNSVKVTTLLGLAGRASQRPESKLPSWAVEWDFVSERPALFKFEETIINGKGSVEAGLPLSLGPLGLRLHAVIVDQVEKIHVIEETNLHNHGLDLFNFFFNNPPMELLPFIVLRRPQYKSGISLLAAAVSTILLGRDVLGSEDYSRFMTKGVPCDNYRRIARIFMRLFWKWDCVGHWAVSIAGLVRTMKQLDPNQEHESVDAQQRIDATLDNMFGFSEGPLTTDDIVEAYQCSHHASDSGNLYNKTPFGSHADQMCGLITQGGFIGAARRGVRPRDLVCFAKGVCTPLIVRRMGDKYELISPCYIEGLEYGDAWAMVRSKEKAVEEILVQ